MNTMVLFGFVIFIGCICYMIKLNIRHSKETAMLREKLFRVEFEKAQLEKALEVLKKK